MNGSPRWKLVYFIPHRKGYVRKEKLIRDPKDERVRQVLTKLDHQGIRAHIVCRRFPKFPPKGTPEDPDQVWCPYCRRWRFFKVPHRQCTAKALEIPCCPWCRISIWDAYVRDYNDLWNRMPKRRRRKGRKKRQRAIAA